MPSLPSDPKRPATPSGGIHVGDLAGERDVNVTLTDVAGGDQIKITNSPGATVIKEAPRKLSREEQLAQRNRQTMLLKVKAYWIDGVLANSLHSKVIPLDMERKPDAVTRPRPWDMLWQHRDQRPQPLPAGTKIGSLFNDAAGDALLILGEPGSGKTTMLLELAGELLAEAQADEALRIPVVFNLSSWAVTRPLLTEWLVSELQTLYLIPKKVAQGWVEQDDILPLLDGLDEVAQEHRAACIKAINAYREAQGTPLVVCSRIADYEAIGEKLLLSDGLLLRPLTQEQINEYLAAGGAALDGVRVALQQDETLQELAQSPLFLSIIAITYRDQSLELLTSNDLDDRRRQLFATYIQRQLHLRNKDSITDDSNTLCHLTYLAHQLKIRDQTIFLIEHLQPDWLSKPQQRRSYRLAVGLIGALLGTASVLINYYWVREPSIGVASGVLLSLMSLVGSLVWMGNIKPIEKTSWSRKNITRRAVTLGTAAGLVSGITVGLISGEADTLFFSMFLSMFGLLIGGLTGGLLSGMNSRSVDFKVTPNEGIANSLLNAIRMGLFFGLSGALIGALIVGIFFSLALGLRVLVAGVTFLPRGTLLLLYVLGLGLFYGMYGGFLLGFVIGLISGLIVGGGIAFVQHYTLRSWLHYYGYLPLDLVPFLDLAAEQLILQKVGGGYRFVHRLLQEYLASLYEGEGVNSGEL